MTEVRVIGAGLAGSEAAWQLAERGFAVRLSEMKPVKMTSAHHCADFAELVCSNSLRGDRLENAVGLLKEELRRLGSLDPAVRRRHTRRGWRLPCRRPLRLFQYGDRAHPQPPEYHGHLRGGDRGPGGAGHHRDRPPDVRRHERGHWPLFRPDGLSAFLSDAGRAARHAGVHRYDEGVVRLPL